MKHILALTLFAGIGFAGTSAAQATTALSVSQIAAAPVQLVAEGCGPGGVRDRFGRCRPARYVPPPPRHRVCPPGFHRTPYGCRRNF